MTADLKELKKIWEDKFLNSGKFKETKKSFQTDSGIEIERFYLPDENFDYMAKLGFPGDYPYTRGVYPTMYRGRLWTMRQYAGFGTAEETNKRFKYLLEHGQMGLSVAFDLPTQMGYDSDHPMAEGEVGRVGVAIDSLQDMEILFDGINLEKITTSMTINATAAILLAMYVAVAKKQGADLKKISGTIQNDILKEYIARGTYIYPPEQSMKLIVDIFQWCNENLPKWNVISISGYHIREAGANAVQELAFTFANAIEYVRSAIKAGLDVNKFGEQLSFFFNAHNNFFEEIAKFRAARRMWARIMKEKFGVTNPEAMKLRFHAQTGGSTLTAQQIENNIVRVTIQALAAVLGGCQSLHTNSKDEALALPTEESARTALRTQQIIAYESGVTDTIDPLAGSYFVEYLTDEIEKRAWEYIERIEAMGGAVKAIEAGFMQSEIARSAYEYQMKIERKEKIIVGVNEFRTDEKQKVEIFKLNEEAIKKQIERLRKLRCERDNDKVKSTLKRLRESALSGENLIPPIIECVEAYATIGEISDTLREIWGEYKEN
ncbi:MAG: methylmalonyl-CoA mutase family protein [Candidatus Kryptonium sp.]|nr:methylmalonyl-CoA mutase family protein [Candidatus Kryptonium sp.]